MGRGSPNGSLKIISLAWPAESAKVPTPSKIAAQPDHTPGVPPTSQIWDPRFLRTYDFARPIRLKPSRGVASKGALLQQRPHYSKADHERAPTF